MKSDELVPYNTSSIADTELFQGTFLVPTNWTSCGPAIYISGAAGLRQSQPVAIALTKDTLSLCTQKGPIWSKPVPAIQDVKVEDITGISFPVNTPTGITSMIPPSATGVVVSFKLTRGGAVGRLILYTLSPDAAYVWVTDISSAMENFSEKHLGKPAKKD